MKKKFSKLFQAKTDDQESNGIVFFKVLNAIYSYLYNESKDDSLTFKMKGFKDIISAILYSFPDSFSSEEIQNEIKEKGFTNSYEVLNELFKKTDISLVSEESIAEEDKFDYIHISFFSEPTPEQRKLYKSIMQNFIIFFCTEDGSNEINSFRILYSGSYFIYYVKNLLDTKLIDIKNPETEIEKIAFNDFEKVLVGICQYLKIELPETISATNLSPKEATQEQYEELLNLITRNEFDEKINKKQAKKMFTKYKKQSEEYDFFEENYEFLENVNCWHSDWKFDPEDAESFISDIINQDFTFEYPEETYSDDLFPYIQKELAKSDLELMNFDTQGDSYMFFVANKKDVNRILELAQILEVQIDRLL